jgi:hypothetical protein
VPELRRKLERETTAFPILCSCEEKKKKTDDWNENKLERSNEKFSSYLSPTLSPREAIHRCRNPEPQERSQMYNGDKLAFLLLPLLPLRLHHPSLRRLLLDLARCAD